MGYQIQYGPEKNNKYPVRKYARRNYRRMWIVAGCALVLCAALTRRPLRNWLFPGDPDVTDAAVSKMTESLQAGEGLREAVTVFCLEVLGDDAKG